MDCPRCKEEIPAGSGICAVCDLEGSGPADQETGLFGAVIPTRNSKALLAYYLGVFSVIPVLGAPLGIVAFVFGLQGLRFAKADPAAKGKVHAWVGILVGGFFGLLWSVLLLAALVGVLAKG